MISADSSTDKMTPDDANPTDGIDSLTNPETFTELDGVQINDEVQVVSEAEFERRDTWGGVAVIGVTDENGDLLLAKFADGHGWMLPNGPVEPGDDYVAAATHWAEVMTGVSVTVDDIDRIRRRHYQTEDGRETIGHHVIFQGSPVEGTAVAENPGLPQQDIETVSWFAHPPADADWDHENFGKDVRRFLGEAEE